MLFYAPMPAFLRAVVVMTFAIILQRSRVSKRLRSKNRTGAKSLPNNPNTQEIK
jgi:hypothetical protein